MKFNSFFTAIALSLVLLTSCKTEEPVQINLDDNVTWALGEENDSLGNAMRYDYAPLKMEYRNLSNLVGVNPNYVWVKIEFEIPKELRGQTLGFVIPYLHFAEKTWLNGTFIGQHGEFYPNPYSTMNSSYYYTLPIGVLNMEGKNQIYIKVFTQGLATISDGLFISNVNDARVKTNWMNFHRSRVYMMFSGILLCASIFFIILFMAHKQEQSYMRNFSYICLATYLLLAYFYGSELPGYSDGIVSHLSFTKITLCCGLCFTIYAIVGFMLEFVEVVQPRSFKYFKRTVLISTVLLIAVQKDMVSLMKLTYPMFIIYLIHFILGISFVIYALFIKEKRHKAILLIIGFLPVVITLVLDFVLRGYFKIIRYPYFALFGWEATIAFFIIFLALKYKSLFVQNEKLTKDLQHEVAIQTADLSLVNEKLEYEAERSKKEMQMASLVQQKFFNKPENNLEGWELGLVYDPLEIVSGDLYDVYYDEKKLNGFALFDVSGHGIASSLLTMLCKNIISRVFERRSASKRNLSDIMYEINERIINAKGGVENYLTGLLVKFEYEVEDETKVTLVSAGHPYPVYYNSEVGEVMELETLETSPHYGAIGMKDVEVSYPEITFNMKKDDLLISFSDGIIETCNEDRVQYGRERFIKVIEENHHKTPDEIIETLKQSVQEFRGENNREDDITIIILKRK